MIKFEYKFLFHCYQFDTAPDATIRFLLSDPKEDSGVDHDKSAQVANLSYCCYNGRLFVSLALNARPAQLYQYSFCNKLSIDIMI